MVNIRIDFTNNLSAAEVEKTIAAIDRDIKSANELVKRVFIEAERRQADKHTTGLIAEKDTGL